MRVDLSTDHPLEISGAATALVEKQRFLFLFRTIKGKHNAGRLNREHCCYTFQGASRHAIIYSFHHRGDEVK